MTALRISGERREQALLAVIRLSGGGKALVLRPALTVGGGRLEEALPKSGWWGWRKISSVVIRKDVRGMKQTLRVLLRVGGKGMELLQ